MKLSPPALLAFDSETHCIQPGLLAPPAVCFSFCIPGGESWVAVAEDGADFLEECLDAGTVLVAHNLAFDAAVLAAYRPELLPAIYSHYDRGLMRCTQTRQELLDIADGLGISTSDSGGQGRRAVVMRIKKGAAVKSGHSLADLMLHFYDVDRSAEKTDPLAWRLRYAELDGVPVNEYPKEAYDYALQDAIDAAALLEAQGGTDLLVNELEQLRRAWALHLVSVYGMRTDPEAVAALDTRIEAEYRALRARMFEEGFYRLEKFSAEDRRKDKQPDGEIVDKKGKVHKAKFVKNTDVIAARVEAAFAAQGLAAPRTDPTERHPEGAIKTDADTLALTGDTFLQELGAGGPVGTIRQTFLPTLKQGLTAPIQTRFRLIETGRISSSQPNLNNFPRAGGVRECIVPRPGYVLCSVDYDCAELRALAQANLWIVGYSEMAKFFQNDPNGDPHTELAASVLGIAPDEARRLRKIKDVKFKEARQAFKAVNLAFYGGLGIEKFVFLARKNYGVTMTSREAFEAKQAWFRRWPEMRAYFDHINQLVGNGAAQVMQLRPGGGPHRKRGGVGYCDAANGYAQGLTADGAAHALWLVSRECYVDESSPLYGSRPIVFLYDEIIAEVPEARAAQAAARLAEVMIAGMQEWLPDVPVTATPALMRRWYKGAEAVYDSSGNLVPWEPPAPTPAASAQAA